MPKVIGLRVDPVGAPDHDGVAMLQSATLQDAPELRRLLLQQLAAVRSWRPARF